MSSKGPDYEKDYTVRELRAVFRELKLIQNGDKPVMVPRAYQWDRENAPRTIAELIPKKPPRKSKKRQPAAQKKHASTTTDAREDEDMDDAQEDSPEMSIVVGPLKRKQPPNDATSSRKRRKNATEHPGDHFQPTMEERAPSMLPCSMDEDEATRSDEEPGGLSAPRRKIFSGKLILKIPPAQLQALSQRPAPNKRLTQATKTIRAAVPNPSKFTRRHELSFRPDTHMPDAENGDAAMEEDLSTTSGQDVQMTGAVNIDVATEAQLQPKPAHETGTRDTVEMSNNMANEVPAANPTTTIDNEQTSTMPLKIKPQARAATKSARSKSEPDKQVTFNTAMESVTAQEEPVPKPSGAPEATGPRSDSPAVEISELATADLEQRTSPETDHRSQPSATTLEETTEAHFLGVQAKGKAAAKKGSHVKKSAAAALPEVQSGTRKSARLAKSTSKSEEPIPAIPATSQARKGTIVAPPSAGADQAATDAAQEDGESADHDDDASENAEIQDAEVNQRHQMGARRNPRIPPVGGTHLVGDYALDPDPDSDHLIKDNKLLGFELRQRRKLRRKAEREAEIRRCEEAGIEYVEPPPPPKKYDWTEHPTPRYPAGRWDKK